MPARLLTLATKPTLLEALGNEPGCVRLSTAFYKRVGRDPVLKPLFPGKTLRCATEEFSAFLIQFLGGDEDQTQKRWWLSLKESHARFRITPGQREAWLKHMVATIDEVPLDDATKAALHQFFHHTSAYIANAPEDTPLPQHDELAERWKQQRLLDDTVVAGKPELFASRPSVFVGLLARRLQAGEQESVLKAVEHDPSLAARKFGGRALLHYAAGAGALEVVETALRHNADPNMQDAGGHTPLYRAANECGTEAGPAIVRALVKAGANVNASGGVTKATPLHMAARRGHLEIAKALLERGANPNARDTKGDTPYQRALNCRKTETANLISVHSRSFPAKT